MLYPNLLRNLKRLRHDSFRLDGPPVIYIDPWKLPADSPAADLVLVTHEHSDHCSPEDIRKISRSGTVVVANPGAAKKLGSNARVLLPGQSLTVGEVTIAAVPAYNVNKFRSPGHPFHPRDMQGNGYIISLGGEKLYHAGDTDLIPEMGQVQATVALLPVSGTYVMTADEAFEAAKVIQAKMFVPMHYGDIVGTEGDVEKFRYLCETQGIDVIVLSAAEEPGPQARS
jgi:L-ascorbate metabolism protein UlaG (beta-lactamase superfamily)